MAATIKLVIYVIVLIAILLVYRQYKKRQKNAKATLLLIFSVSALVALYSLRLENLVLSYESPQSAFLNSGCHGTMQKIVDTEDSTFIIYNQSGGESYLFLTKQNGRWKVPLNRKTPLIAAVNPNILVSVCKEDDVQNCYIALTVMDERKVNVSDNKSTVFEQYSESMYTQKYVAFVENVDETYCIQVNNLEIYLNILMPSLFSAPAKGTIIS
ncbi:hypothetical protein [Ruminococcus sp.]|uniref:hypothetical protein n=1 Tax=Ruminococcus sp. TaxID=41978 RepID=UPI0025EEE50D|nr:hypothetical protein [Ruminococcus sp.]